MCGGGGGGGLDKSTVDLQKYQLAQAKQEEQRLKDEEARQQQAKNAIRVLYGYEPLSGVDMSKQSVEAKTNAAARQAGYDQIRASNMAILQDDINRNRNDAARLLKFGLSRSGLSGGSVDIDENRNLTDANQRSIIQANQLSDNQVQQVRAKDESDYATAIQKIDAGLDADTAITTATQAVKNNRDQAISDPTSSSLNNLFASIGNAWGNYQYGQAAANPYGRSTAISSTGGSKGRLS